MDRIHLVAIFWFCVGCSRGSGTFFSVGLVVRVVVFVAVWRSMGRDLSAEGMGLLFVVLIFY